MSVTLKAENLDEFIQSMTDWVEANRKLAQEVAIGIAADAFDSILEHSAQFSGDFAANWKLSIGSPDFSYETDLFVKVGPYGRIVNEPDRIMGHPEAIEYARANAAGALRSFKLGDDIWIANGVQHEEAYSWLIEENKIKFRPGNTGRPVGNWLDKATVTYYAITAAGAERLQVEGGLYR